MKPKEKRPETFLQKSDSRTQKYRCSIMDKLFHNKKINKEMFNLVLQITRSKIYFLDMSLIYLIHLNYIQNTAEHSDFSDHDDRLIYSKIRCYLIPEMRVEVNQMFPNLDHRNHFYRDRNQLAHLVEQHPCEEIDQPVSY